jgi:hypothetical protein
LRSLVTLRAKRISYNAYSFAYALPRRKCLAVSPSWI